MRTWSTPIKEYKEINGIRVSVRGEAAWNLSSGDFCYFGAEITDIEYKILQYIELTFNSWLNNQPQRGL